MTTTSRNRKQDILDAALACFTEHGIEATTIDMIRERSGASVGSMYHHFGNKETIAATLYVAALDEHTEYQRKLLEQARSAEEGVKAVAYAYIDWVSQHPDKARFVLFNRGVVAAKSEQAAELKAHNRQKMSDLIAWFKPHLERGAMKTLPLEVFGSLIIGPTHDYARLWLSGRARTDIKAYREVFAEAAWSSVKP